MSVLYGMDRPDRVARAHVIELVPYAIALYLLATGFGLVGVALAWTVRMALDAFLLGVFSGMWSDLFKKSIVPIGVMLLAMAVSDHFSVQSVERWILSGLVLISVLLSTMLLMPKKLVSLLDRFPLLRPIPFGVLAERGFWR